MKTLSFKFVFELLLAFALFSFILYALEVSPFYFPHFPAVMTILYTEKNVRKRIIYMILATLIYSQVSAPAPFFFLFVTAAQIYMLTVSFFASTAFDYPLTALLNTILSCFLMNLNRFFYVYVNASEVLTFSFFIPFFFSSIILIFLFVIFKSKVNVLFRKDTWL